MPFTGSRSKFEDAAGDASKTRALTRLSSVPVAPEALARLTWLRRPPFATVAKVTRQCSSTLGRQ